MSSHTVVAAIVRASRRISAGRAGILTHLLEHHPPPGLRHDNLVCARPVEHRRRRRSRDGRRAKGGRDARDGAPHQRPVAIPILDDERESALVTSKAVLARAPARYTHWAS